MSFQLPIIVRLTRTRPTLLLHLLEPTFSPLSSKGLILVFVLILVSLSPLLASLRLPIQSCYPLRYPTPTHLIISLSLKTLALQISIPFIDSHPFEITFGFGLSLSVRSDSLDSVLGAISTGFGIAIHASDWPRISYTMVWKCDDP